MEQISSGSLKAILHSKRANLYYLEHCRVLVKGGRVCYVSKHEKRSAYWNIPIANTTCILLGTGTSITQLAVRELARAGVMIGFSGGAGTPLFAGTEAELQQLWIQGQSEYRPTEYLQSWIRLWPDDARRLRAAKLLQTKRLQVIDRTWLESRVLREQGFSVAADVLRNQLRQARAETESAPDVNALLVSEARLTRTLYRIATQATGHTGDFVRVKQGEGLDLANQFLDHGNYLAYGLGACACWVLGLPHGLAVLHGKTRRGGLVFDLADVVKDALVLPQAFLSAADPSSDEQNFRNTLVSQLTRVEALDLMIDTVKEIIADSEKAT